MIVERTNSVTGYAHQFTAHTCRDRYIEDIATLLNCSIDGVWSILLRGEPLSIKWGRITFTYRKVR